MKISLNWIEQILGKKLNLSSQEVSDLLLRLGFEVSQTQSFPKCSGVVVSEILDIGKHPNADRLRIAKVSDGKETLSVVCGAPNIAVGQKVFWAKVGAALSDGKKIQESAIRGVKSPGMICSLKELGVGEDQSGIWSLDDAVSIGSSLEEMCDLGDTVLDVEVTPNRPDCLSMIGIAREMAAALNIKIPLQTSLSENRPDVPAYPVEVQVQIDCPRYIAKKFENIRVSSSPFYIQVRLIRCGIRPINNIVDLTNYILLETGQPLHAFDADKLEGGKIVVRRAKENEKILALDGKIYPLYSDILVIADAKKPVAIAGIMGGEETAVTDSTRNILLESAIFDRRLIRYGRKKINLSSESSYRFERGVSRWSCWTGSLKAESLIVQHAKGKIAGYTDFYSELSSQKSSTTSISLSNIEKILGEKISRTEIQTILQNLSIPLLSFENNQFSLQSPDWRLDLNLEVDYIEEIARLRGYDKIPSTGTQVRLATSTLSQNFSVLKGKIISILQSMGFYESCNYGLVDKKDVGFFGLDKVSVPIGNPLSEDQSLLRPTLVIELLKNLKQNLSYSKKEIRLFEFGKIFRRDDGNLNEKIFLAGAACGQSFPQSWQFKDSKPIDFFWIKGVVEKIFSESQMADVQLHQMDSSDSDFSWTSKILHPHEQYGIMLHGKIVGCLGMIHPQMSESLGPAGNTAIFEVDLEKMQEKFISQKKVRPVLRTPFIQRDCSIWVSEEVSWSELITEIKKVGGSILEGCVLFDVYRDDGHPRLKSLSMTFTFRHLEKTLSDETANEMREKIVNHLHQKFKAELRKK